VFGVDYLAVSSFTSTPLFEMGLGDGWGCNDFEVGAMAVGLVEAAWVAEGLPASGSSLLRLTVKDVCVRQLQHYWVM
jgi:hypothetical protein